MIQLGSKLAVKNGTWAVVNFGFMEKIIMLPGRYTESNLSIVELDTKTHLHMGVPKSYGAK